MGQSQSNLDKSDLEKFKKVKILITGLKSSGKSSLFDRIRENLKEDSYCLEGYKDIMQYHCCESIRFLVTYSKNTPTTEHPMVDDLFLQIAGLQQNQPFNGTNTLQNDNITLNEDNTDIISEQISTHHHDSNETNIDESTHDQPKLSKLNRIKALKEKNRKKRELQGAEGYTGRLSDADATSSPLGASPSGSPREGIVTSTSNSPHVSPRGQLFKNDSSALDLSDTESHIRKSSMDETFSRKRRKSLKNAMKRVSKKFVSLARSSSQAGRFTDGAFVDSDTPLPTDEKSMYKRVLDQIAYAEESDTLFDKLQIIQEFKQDILDFEFVFNETVLKPSFAKKVEFVCKHDMVVKKHIEDQRAFEKNEQANENKEQPNGEKEQINEEKKGTNEEKEQGNTDKEQPSEEKHDSTNGYLKLFAYFLKHIDRICTEDYIPTNEDLDFYHNDVNKENLDGISMDTLSYYYNRNIFTLNFLDIDFGDSKKMFHHLETSHFLCFMCPIGDFDLEPETENGKNIVLESLELFEFIGLNNKRVLSIPIVLLFTKYDLFENKIHSNDLISIFPDYSAGTVLTPALSFIYKKFSDMRFSHIKNQKIERTLRSRRNSFTHKFKDRITELNEENSDEEYDLSFGDSSDEDDHKQERKHSASFLGASSFFQKKNTKSKKSAKPNKKSAKSNSKSNLSSQNSSHKNDKKINLKLYPSYVTLSEKHVVQILSGLMNNVLYDMKKEQKEHNNASSAQDSSPSNKTKEAPPKQRKRSFFNKLLKSST